MRSQEQSAFCQTGHTCANFYIYLKFINTEITAVMADQRQRGKNNGFVVCVFDVWTLPGIPEVTAHFPPRNRRVMVEITVLKAK